MILASPSTWNVCIKLGIWFCVCADIYISFTVKWTLSDFLSTGTQPSVYLFSLLSLIIVIVVLFAVSAALATFTGNCSCTSCSSRRSSFCHSTLPTSLSSTFASVSYIFLLLYLLHFFGFCCTVGSHFYPTLFAAVVCHSLDVSITPTLGRIIFELFRSALWTLLVIGDGGLQTILAQNRGGRPAANESRTSDGETTRPGQIGMAATCGNGYVFDNLLKKKKWEWYSYYQ